MKFQVAKDRIKKYLRVLFLFQIKTVQTYRDTLYIELFALDRAQNQVCGRMRATSTVACDIE